MASESGCPRTFRTPSSHCACLLVQSANVRGSWLAPRYSRGSCWLSPPHLSPADFFQGKRFFLYGEFPGDERRTLSRYVTAFNGSVSRGRRWGVEDRIDTAGGQGEPIKATVLRSIPWIQWSCSLPTMPHPMTSILLQRVAGTELLQGHLCQHCL